MDLAITRVVTRPYGWAFAYQPKMFLESGNSDDSLVGPGPLLVLRHDGSIVFLFTGRTIENELLAYERGEYNS